ncbi:MAG: hypothetical protein NTX50_31840 [Candidatus Sumerlaeota bacterium]|nr:hypothetical protein [Candidatus Sumerlaeota bacterium]
MSVEVPQEISQYVDNAVWELSEKRDLRPGAVAYSINRIFGISYTIDDVMDSLRAMKRERRRDRDSRHGDTGLTGASQV